MANNTHSSDLPDSEKDKKQLQPETAVLDLPDVKDIPGQENIHAPDLKEMADTTISSDDEEGVSVFGTDDSEFSGERLAAGEELSEDDLIIKDEEENGDAEDDDLDVTDDFVNDDSNVTEEEKKALEKTEDMDSQDNEDLFKAELDDEDFEGEKLNESIDLSGDDLDIPGEEDDDADEETGEEDEENNAYSLGDNK